MKERWQFYDIICLAGLLSRLALARTLEMGSLISQNIPFIISKVMGLGGHFEKEAYGTRQKVPNPKLSN